MDKSEWQAIKKLYNEAIQRARTEQIAFVNANSDASDAVKSKVIDMLSTETLGAANLVQAHASDALNSSHLIGTSIEQFKIQSLIGEGGMGQVYLATRETDDFQQDVAIKFLQINKLSSENQQRFYTERQILASLKHKNIAALVGGGQTDDNQPYIIMEYVCGQTITHYCKSKALSIAARIELFMQVLSAVIYAHQNLIVHRDIKAGNVLVTEHGDVKLLDFGIAKIVEETQGEVDVNVTRKEQRHLSLLSASPEQILGERVSVLTDVYSLGALLYELLTEHPLFDTSTLNAKEIENHILQSVPPPPSQVQALNLIEKDIAKDIDTIVLKAIHKSPERRYGSVEQLKDDLFRALNHYPIKARPDSHWYTFSKFISRNKLASALSAGLVTSLCTFSGALLYQSGVIKQERDKAITQAQIARQTTDYMSTIFNAADPNTNDGEVITAKMLLDEASTSIDELEASPEIKIEMLLLLSRVYRHISEYALAQSLLDKAFLLRESIEKTSDNTQRLDIALFESQGDLYIYVGQYKKAISQFEHQLTVLDGWDTNHMQTGFDDIRSYYDAYRGLATANTYMDSPETALTHYRAALSIIEGSHLEEEFKSSALMALGHALRQNGELEASKETLLAGIEFEREHANQDSLDLAHGLNQLASTLIGLNELDDALVYAAEGLAIREKMHNEGNIEIIASMGVVSNIYARQNKPKDALDIRQASIAHLKTNLGEEHPFVGRTYTVIGRLNLQLKNYHDAVDTLEKSLANLEKAYSPTHLHVGRTLSFLSQAYLATQRTNKAVEASNRALNILSDQLSTNDASLALATLTNGFALKAFTAKEFEQKSLSPPYDKALVVFETKHNETSTQYQQLIQLMFDVSALNAYPVSK